MSKISYVWNATLDDRYEVTVDQDAVLRVHDSELGETVMEKKDHFTWEPRFGPFEWDVMRWQKEVVNFIDNVYEPTA